MKYNYLFYFSNEIGSVFDSQVVALLNSLAEKRYFKNIYLFLGVRNNLQKKECLNRNINEGIEIIYFSSFPNYPLFNILQRRKLSKVLNGVSINFEKVVFHTRGELLSWHLSKILGKRYYNNILPDIRGATSEEVSEYFVINGFKKILKLYNYKAALRNLNKFKKLTVVSNSLSEYLISNYQIDRKVITVIPCLAGKNFYFDQTIKKQTRKKLNLTKNEKLLVFTNGGEATWQNNNLLRDLTDKGFKILNLSKKEIIHKNVINKFVKYSEVPSFLNAADAAFIFRDASVVNKVASPVKFSEYICCGLPVIANNNVDMINEFIKTHAYGAIVENIHSINLNLITQLNQIERSEIANIGSNKFGVEIISKMYQECYNGEAV